MPCFLNGMWSKEEIENLNPKQKKVLKIVQKNLSIYTSEKVPYTAALKRTLGYDPIKNLKDVFYFTISESRITNSYLEINKLYSMVEDDQNSFKIVTNKQLYSWISEAFDKLINQYKGSKELWYKMWLLYKVNLLSANKYIETNIQAALNHSVEAYKILPNSQDSILIADLYYKQGNRTIDEKRNIIYQLSYRWALQTLDLLKIEINQGISDLYKTEERAIVLIIKLIIQEKIPETISALNKYLLAQTYLQTITFSKEQESDIVYLEQYINSIINGTLLKKTQEVCLNNEKLISLIEQGLTIDKDFYAVIKLNIIDKQYKIVADLFKTRIFLFPEELGLYFKILDQLLTIDKEPIDQLGLLYKKAYYYWNGICGLKDAIKTIDILADAFILERKSFENIKLTLLCLTNLSVNENQTEQLEYYIKLYEAVLKKNKEKAVLSLAEVIDIKISIAITLKNLKQYSKSMANVKGILDLIEDQEQYKNAKLIVLNLKNYLNYKLGAFNKENYYKFDINLTRRENIQEKYNLLIKINNCLNQPTEDSLEKAYQALINLNDGISEPFPTELEEIKTEIENKRDFIVNKLAEETDKALREIYAQELLSNLTKETNNVDKPNSKKQLKNICKNTNPLDTTKIEKEAEIDTSIVKEPKLESTNFSIVSRPVLSLEKVEEEFLDQYNKKSIKDDGSYAIFDQKTEKILVCDPNLNKQYILDYQEQYMDQPTWADELLYDKRLKKWGSKSFEELERAGEHKSDIYSHKFCKSLDYMVQLFGINDKYISKNGSVYPMLIMPIKIVQSTGERTLGKLEYTFYNKANKRFLYHRLLREHCTRFQKKIYKKI